MNMKKSVKIALAHKEVKQRWLAGRIGMSQGALSTILSKNNPTAETIEKFAVALDMSVSDLIALGE